MEQKRSIGHIFYAILGVCAGIFGITAGFFTVVVGLEIPARVTMLDLAPAFAIMGVGSLSTVAIAMFALWGVIYRNAPDRSKGATIWACIFGAHLCVNYVVFDGFVRRHMSHYLGGETVRSYIEGIEKLFASAGGLNALLLFWPLIPIFGFATMWVRSRPTILSIPS